ncbi:MAG: polysaccharide biosynthesis tyrosine autokinase [Anaerolinea sp.]|nr:polysaccharide biosynthesis tyrosine autokinase [Anaerolinea sp.]
MELREYANLIWRWLWLIILGTVTAGAAAYLVSRNQPPIYRATAILLVSEGAADSNEYRSLLVGEQLAQSYVKRLTNYQVLEQAIANVGLDMEPTELQKQIQVTLLNETQLIALSVLNPNPHTASRLANEIPAVFARRNVEQQMERFASSKLNLETELSKIEMELKTAENRLTAVKQQAPPDNSAIDQASTNVIRLQDTYSRLLQSYENIRVAEASSLNTIIIDETARPSGIPVSPKVRNNTLLAAAVGAMLTIGLAFLIEYLDDTIKNPREIEQGTGLTPLGHIERMRITDMTDALVVATDPRSPAAEAFRHIRTNIQYVSVDRPLHTLLITSANMGEGKSTVSINLAAALAQSGKQVILVDADMRRPTLHKLLEVDGSKGLANLIIRGREDTSFLKGTLITNLRLLPAGRIPPNPAELLGSERMKDVLAWLQQQADYVIFDSPPVLAVTDGVVLSQLVDSTLFVIGEQTKFLAFVAAVKQVKTLESHISGVIMNKINPRHSRNYYYYYYQTNYPPFADDTNGENGSDRRSWKQWVQQALYGLNIFQ